MPASFQDRYNQLNDRQKLAVDTIQGPVLVVAGPGSGKTELLSLRVANILRKTDVFGSNILCLTFTEAAAQNMRERLAGLIGQDAYQVAIHTFHSFGVDIINKYPGFFYEGATFLPIDELGQIEILESLLRELPFDNPLRSEHPEEGFVYLRDVRQAIGNLKKGGLDPATFREIIAKNRAFLAETADSIHAIFDERLSMKGVAAIEDFVSGLAAQQDTSPSPYFRTLREALVLSLGKACQEADTLQKTTPLSEWKASHLAKDESGKRVLKDAASIRHMEALAGLYESYQQALATRRYIDFDDMLLTSIAGIKTSEALHSELQEKYQYILVDEFQDTNEAQMAILDLLTDSPLHEGRPNVMAVGDDDQAIYKFQGAELANILSFKDKYNDPLIITLVNNYRSTQPILDVARQVIIQGGERLENILPEVEKVLVAANPSLSGNISNQTFTSKEQEHLWMAREIKRLIDGKILPPEEIAVIGRHHKDLEELVPYLRHEGISLNYRRQQNVLNAPHVRQIIRLLRFVQSLGRKDQLEADDLLPEILSYPFWEIDRIALWKLSVEAYRDKRLWLECMLEHTDSKIKGIAGFLIELSGKAHFESIEFILQHLIGAEDHPLSDSDQEDEEQLLESGLETTYRSPFKAYYFSRANFEENRETYLGFLSNLKSFIEALREYKHGEPLSLDDALEFIDIHQRYGLPITDGSAYTNSQDAVSLHTSHSAKGLEFGAVFVLNCLDEVWAGRGRNNLIRFPENLPLAPAADSLDDHLRIFYVAVTRAKECLYFTAYDRNHTGKEMSHLQFLRELEAQGNPDSKEIPSMPDSLERGWQSYQAAPPAQPERSLLLSLVENYKMSVTHLNNFLNVEKGGPRQFLEQNLLRFPQPKSAAGAYGSAVHAALRALYCELKKTGKVPPEEFLLESFQRQMVMERMPGGFLEANLDKGHHALAAFYQAHRDSFNPEDEVERDFSGQQVTIGEAKLSGKIDRIMLTGPGEVQVVDYKTGKAAASWNGTSAHEKTKLWGYRRQLLFYKILIENSRDYGRGFTVTSGCLEFVEPTASGKLVTLSLEYEAGEVERLGRLAQAVYAKIKALDFPDTSGYSPDLKGVMEFEEDLLNNF